MEEFTERELTLIDNCREYAAHPGGLPGHQLMLLVAKLAGKMHTGANVRMDINEVGPGASVTGVRIGRLG